VHLISLRYISYLNTIVTPVASHFQIECAFYGWAHQVLKREFSKQFIFQES